MDFQKMRYRNELNEEINLELRNVGDKNPKASIQIKIERTCLSGRRQSYTLNIPLDRENQFLAAIQPKL